MPVPTFCTYCAASLEPRPYEGRMRPTCTGCGQIAWQDPKVAACTIPTDGSRVLLIRRGIEPSRGLWSFPGGYLDRGETVEDAAIRETREEVGLEVVLDELVGVYSSPDSVVVVVVYGAHAVGGQLRSCPEVEAAAWFEPGDIPWHELAFASSEQALRQHLQRACSPRVPAPVHEAMTR
jgi:8-oxo-dGTP diphosphatase